MLIVSILEAEDFGEELYSVMRENLTDLIKQQHVGVVTAAGDSKGMIYRLLSELSIEYPHVFFTILLSNDKLAYEGSVTECPHIFSLDCNIAYDDHQNATQRRRKILIERSDIVFCRKTHCNGIRKINRYCDIIAI